MLLDPYGEVTITNDGYTILSMMDATHPVTKLLIHAIQTQQDEWVMGQQQQPLWLVPLF